MKRPMDGTYANKTSEGGKTEKSDTARKVKGRGRVMIVREVNIE